MLEEIFDRTVDLLETISDKTKISYKKINVIGMFAWIGVTVGLAVKAFKKTKKQS